jgi:aminopeptidase N
MKRTHWRESATIPVHCMVIGAAEFTIVRAGAWNGTEIAYYLYPQDRDHGVGEMGRTREMLEYFSTLVGPYPYEKLALVESSTRFGGMENASAVFLDEKRIDGKGTLEGLVAHEIAHQWFGDSVSQRQWYDLWLSEGFAKYFERLFLGHVSGRDAFAAAMEADRQEYLEAFRKKPNAIHDPTADLFSLLNPNNYEKGSWVLHMLRATMGDRAFFDGIREYYAAHRDRNVSTADFRMVMERHAGQPLDWFFRQWIFEPGHPVYALAWTWSAGKVAIDVEQRQQPLFRMPVSVEVRTGASSKRGTVVIDERRERFEIDSDEEPDTVVLDPDNVVLKEIVTQ